MSALPVQHLPVQEQQEAEVIYVVLPKPATIAAHVRPYSMVELASAMWFDFRMRSHKSSEKALAMSFAFFFTLVFGLWAYYVKSAFGIDIFPYQHLENFVPLPGWQR